MRSILFNFHSKSVSIAGDAAPVPPSPLRHKQLMFLSLHSMKQIMCGFKILANQEVFKDNVRIKKYLHTPYLS